MEQPLSIVDRLFVKVEDRISAMQDQIARDVEARVIARLLDGLDSPAPKKRAASRPAATVASSAGELKTRVLAAVRGGAHSLAEISEAAGEPSKSRVARALARLKSEKAVKMTGLRRTAKYFPTGK